MNHLRFFVQKYNIARENRSFFLSRLAKQARISELHAKTVAELAGIRAGQPEHIGKIADRVVNRVAELRNRRDA